MFIKLKERKAQSITEYAVLMGIIVLAIVLTQVYLKRSIQGKFKSTADDLGEQFTTGRNYTLQTVQQSMRNDKTAVGDNLTLSDAWSQSTIADNTNATWYQDIKAVSGVATDATLREYAGGEVTNKDYVNPTGGHTVGTHGNFSSGVLQDLNPFTEANQTGS